MFCIFKMLIKIIVLLLSTRLASCNFNCMRDDAYEDTNLVEKDVRAVFLTPFRCEADPLPDPSCERVETSNEITFCKYWDDPVLIFLTVLTVAILFGLAHIVNNRNKKHGKKHAGFRFSKLGNSGPVIHVARKRYRVESRRKDSVKITHGVRIFKRRKKKYGYIQNNADRKESEQRSTNGTIYKENFGKVRSEIRSVLKPATYIGIALDERVATQRSLMASICDTTFNVSVVQKNFTFFGNDMVSVYQYGSLLLAKILWEKTRSCFSNNHHCLSNKA